MEEGEWKEEGNGGNDCNLRRSSGSLATRQTISSLIVPGSNPAWTQPTADCRFPDGLSSGMILRRRPSSGREDRGRNSTKKTLCPQNKDWNCPRSFPKSQKQYNSPNTTERTFELNEDEKEQFKSVDSLFLCYGL